LAFGRLIHSNKEDNWLFTVAIVFHDILPLTSRVSNQTWEEKDMKVLLNGFTYKNECW